MDYISTQDAAHRLGISPRRVLALITQGRLPAAKLGRDWMIDPKDLEKVRDRPTGRPPKKKAPAKRRRPKAK
jgi:excisionase family DNA binding protein